MGVMCLFDGRQKLRAAMKDGVTEWIHHEHDYTLDATVLIKYSPRPGEYVGFECVDGLWRLFCIDKADEDSSKGLTYIKATDAAVDDMRSIVVQDAYQENVDASTAAETLLGGTEWRLGTVTAGTKKNTTDAQWTTLWDALQTAANVFGVRMVPHYVISNGEITNKLLDVLDGTPVRRGRFFENAHEGTSINVIYNQRPYTVMYGLGKAGGTNNAERLTIADAVWSKNNGDPTDKPAGQKWVENAEAVARYGRRERVVVVDNAEDAITLLQETWKTLQEECKPKVTVDAEIRDMEAIKGQEWKAIRINDLVTVRTKNGEDVEVPVRKIDRNYLQKDRTVLAAGEEQNTATKQIASLARAAIHTQEKLTIYRNKFLHDEALIQLNADTILMNAKEIKAKADKIELDAYVTITKLEAEIARLESVWAEYFYTTTLGAEDAMIENINAGNVDAAGVEASAITINGAPVATMKWVTGTALTPYATQAWVMANFQPR